MRVTTLDIDKYDTIADEIIRVANTIWDPLYKKEHVEIIMSLRDYGDGKGTQLVTTAALHSAVKIGYDLQVCIVGEPNEALDKLLNELVSISKISNSIKKMN